MNPFRANNDWLRYKTILLLRQKHKDLFEPFYKPHSRNLRNFISNSKQWWLILSVILIIFIISPFINIEILNFIEISTQTSTSIVDQRTANIATIISITLVVVGFILNNLAVKSPLVYGLLFKKTLLYPIIYLILSVIGTFIVISTLRDTLPSFIYSRLVLTGTYFALLILFLIGMLFRKVFLFSNEKEIDKMLEVELIIEARTNLKRILIQKYSEEIYVATLQQKGAKEYDWSEAWANISPQTNSIPRDEVIIKNDKIIDDINLKYISNFITKKNVKEQLFYQKISLESIINEADNYIWEKNKFNSKTERGILKKALVLKKNNSDEYHETVRKFFDEKFELASDQDRSKDFEKYLSAYLKLYELQIQNQ